MFIYKNDSKKDIIKNFTAELENKVREMHVNL